MAVSLTYKRLLSYHHFLMSRVIPLCVTAWLIPGGGHLLLNKWGRGLAFFVSILVLFVCGLVMDGRLFGLTPGFFGVLKFVADAGAGLPYVVGKLLGWGEGNVTSYGYEYGNTYLFAAGLLNMLLVVDTFDIARGRKS